MSLSKIFLFVVMAGFCVGCHSFHESFEFRNKSNVEIWVDEVSGFETRLACGTLTPNATKGEHMQPMRLPKQTTIIWSEGHESYVNPSAPKYTNVVSLRPVVGFSLNTQIVFEFASNRVWRVFQEHE